MNDYDDLIQSATVRFNDKTVKFCAPLFEFCNLNKFYYFKITDEGYFTVIDSHPSFSEYWASEKIYLNFPNYRHPKFYKEGISILHYDYDIEENGAWSILDPFKEKFNFHTWVRIVNKLPNGVEEMGFTSYSILSDMHCSQLLSEVAFFRMFLSHFKRENKEIFYKMEDNQIDIAKLIGPKFYTNDMPEMPPCTKRKDLLQKMGWKIGPRLNPSDVEVVKLLLDGYSAARIASQLYRSRRTVEHRLEKLKEKLSCSSKFELLQKARELEAFGYLEQN